MITLSRLQKTYNKGKVRAVDGIDLSVKPGELFGFLGPNGAGKSTTIRMITGLLKPDAGSIRIAGVDPMTDPVAAKAKIGYVPDESIAYERMSGQGYLQFIAEMFSVPPQQRGKVRELAERFELDKALGDLVSSYSHGMKQKLAVIAALLHDPEVFILDEPMIGLDPKSSFTLKTIMRELCDQGRTVFFSTHVMEVAEKLCDRVGIISQGRMVAVGKFEDLRATKGSAGSTGGAAGSEAGESGEADSGMSLEKVFLELTEGSTDARGSQG